jgi:FkbM family methyltransferase
MLGLRFVRNLPKLPNYLKSLGLVGGLVAYGKIYLSAWTGAPFSVRVGDSDVWMRRQLSDASTFFQIFVKREYQTSQWLQHRKLQETYRRIVSDGRLPIIVDAGANIGLSVKWFRTQYPLAKIYAIEPDDQNFEILARNAHDDANVVPLRGAIWDRSTKLRISNPEAGSASFRVVEGEGSLRAYSIQEILDQEGRGSLLIAKVDIEGGESALFRSNVDWVKQAAMLVIELHDWKYPGEGTSQTFLKAMSELPVDFLAQGENFFCFSAAGGASR